MGIGQLMKNLRDKGWIPRGYNEVVHAVYDKRHKMIGLYKEGKEYLHLAYKKSLRELVSKESGLWQFVCENGMYKSVGIKYSYFCNTSKINYMCNSYQYRLIKSALCDEDKLEQFLLDNIKIEG